MTVGGSAPGSPDGQVRGDRARGDRGRTGIALLAAVLGLVLLAPPMAMGEGPSSRPVLSWETGEGRSFLIPALEVPGFIAALNQFDRHVIDEHEYGSDLDSIWDNLTGRRVIDRDPFSVNQLGHPYQGSIYYGLARSAGLNYWESLLYTLVGSFIWENAGETTRPSINDHVATGISGTFLGEAMFRMASLLLENGGERPGFWRELGAAVISPPTGFNRLVFGDRFDAVFPSRHPALAVRLRLGGTVVNSVVNEGLSVHSQRPLGSIDFSLAYGLPGQPGYRYTRPFDYFTFEFTGVPNVDTVDDAVENVSIRGLLAGKGYAWGPSHRGVWGLFGAYEYLSPQVFRVSTTALGLGTVDQWWLSRSVALQGRALGNLGFGAAGTAADKEERDYHYGLIPEVLLGARLIIGDRAMLEATGREYFVAGSGAGGGAKTDDFGAETITRGTAGITVRLFGPHAIGLHYVVSTRDATLVGQPDRRQKVETVTLSYSFLGQTRFGAVEWRPEVRGTR